MKSSSKKAMKELKNDLDSHLASFFNDLLVELKKNTPVRTGKAKKGWKKVGNPTVSKRSSSVVIRNDVEYSAVLDTGTSNQAPDGIIEPALRKTLSKNN